MCCAAIGFRPSAYNLVCNAFFAALAVADGASNVVLVRANKVSFASRNALFGPHTAILSVAFRESSKTVAYCGERIFRATYATKPMPATIQSSEELS